MSAQKRKSGLAPFLMPLVCVPLPSQPRQRKAKTTACQVVDANVALRSTAVRVQTIYQKGDILAVRHNRGREISPFWLAVLLEDVHIKVNGGDFVQQRVSPSG